jgi:hypothetical protein
MRKQSKYIYGTALALAAGTALVDVLLQLQEQKQKGSQFTWDTFNGLRTFKWAAAGAIAGGILGNGMYLSKFRKDCAQAFSPDCFIKDTLAAENLKSDPDKYKAVKTIKAEMKNTLFETFSDDLAAFPEDVGSLAKATAIASTYDGDIVLAVKRSNRFGTLSKMSATIHETIEQLYGGTAVVTKRRKATNILFNGLPEPVSIDVVYGRERDNYLRDKKLNLYIRPQFFWQSGTYFKTDVNIQKKLFIGKPKVREVVKALKLYFRKNHVAVESFLIEQLVLEAMSCRNYGTDPSVTENLLNSMDYIAQKLHNTVIKDYANSNHNLARKIDANSKDMIIDLLDSDLNKIALNRHYIREAFHF